MKTALLVIDFINGIIGGSCKKYANKHPIVSKTNQLISGFRKSGAPIYFVRLAFDKSYTDLPKHSRMFNYIKEHKLFLLGNNDANFIDELDIQPDDTIINKTAASPFRSPNLKGLLEEKGIEKLVFAGLATDNAINIGVREANDMGYYTVVAKDTCGSSSEDFHNWTLIMLEKIANEILTVDEILNVPE